MTHRASVARAWSLVGVAVVPLDTPSMPLSLVLTTLLLPPAHGATPADTLLLTGAGRGRRVPVTVWSPPLARCAADCPVALIGTGYGARTGDYAFLARGLAAAGVIAVTIQHDLADDAPMPNTGDVRRDRTPWWERGVATLRFVASALRASHPQGRWNAPILVGHSNGGDIAALYAARYPHAVAAVVTLDHRRVPVPCAPTVPVLTLRSADQVADPGVLDPPCLPLSRPDLRVVTMAALRHDDMTGAATPAQRQRIVDVIVEFLRSTGRVGTGRSGASASTRATGAQDT